MFPFLSAEPEEQAKEGEDETQEEMKAEDNATNVTGHVGTSESESQLEATGSEVKSEDKDFASKKSD